MATIQPRTASPARPTPPWIGPGAFASRRGTLLLTLGLLLACAPGDLADEQPEGLPESDEPYDLLIHGGTVVDGTGADRRSADVLVRHGRVAHVGTVDPDAVDVIERFDATGLVVAPGFIDPHAHGSPLEDATFPNFLAMGVTTIVLGLDGSSPEAGALASHLEEVRATSPSVNIGYMIGHNTIRMESGVAHGEPDSGGIERMANLVEQAMDAGAFGLSMSLEYDPGTRAGMDELETIARPVAEWGGVVMSHLRSEDADRVEESVEELLEQGRRSGAHVHASHLKVVLGDDPEQARRILARMDDARSEGLRVTGDVYPYTASFTGLAILFPQWARPPHDYDQVVASRRGELAEHLRRRVESRNGPAAMLFGTGPWPGRTLEEVSEALGRPFEEILVELGPGGARAAYFVMDEGVMRTFLQDPHVVVSSDGSPTMGHPRGYGSFARVLRRYVVEEELLGLEEAVRKMTGLTATILRLDDPDRVEVPRGIVQEGFAADLVAFRPDEVNDRADYENPHQLAEGMRAVWVAGELAFHDGEATPGPGRGTVIR